MKKLVFSIMMCVAAMSTNAQVLTSETVNNVYEAVINQTKGDFVFNADWTGNNITTMSVYKKNESNRGMVTLKPHLKYEYSYANDGMLISKVVYRWEEGRNSWTCTARYDYTLSNGIYSTEYCRYNRTKGCYEQPVDKMVYSLISNDSVNYVSYYHRSQPSSLVMP